MEDSRHVTGVLGGEKWKTGGEDVMMEMSGFPNTKQDK